MNGKHVGLIAAVAMTTIFLASAAQAEIWIRPIIADGMVLQRETNAPIWGKATPGATIQVSFRGNTASAPANGSGQWRVAIPTGKAGGPFSMKLSGDGAFEVMDILVGDVWLASGQSNMARGGATNTPAAVKGKVRLFTDRWDKDPRSATIVGWQFALAIHQSEGIPIGVLSKSVGGTPIRRWYAERISQTDNDLYKKHIEPIVPFGIKGVIWWQGETDRYSGLEYDHHLTKLIREWRQVFQQGDIPFIYVQLQSVGDTPGGYIHKWRKWDLLRVGQMHALNNANTAMAVTYDITTGDVHPPMDERMQIVERLVRAAQATVYGHDQPYMGPLVETAAWRQGKVELTFSHIHGGLVARDGALREFDIKAADGPFRPAEAAVQDDKVLVDADGLKPPVYVRYAVRLYPRANLFNQAGLPASPFITDAIGPDADWQRGAAPSANYPDTGQTEPMGQAAENKAADTPTQAAGLFEIDNFDSWQGWKVHGISNCEATVEPGQGTVGIRVPRKPGERDMWAAGKSIAIPIGGKRTLNVRLRATKGAQVTVRVQIAGKLTSLIGYKPASGDWETMSCSIEGDTGTLVYLILGENAASHESPADEVLYEFDRIWIE